MAEQYIQKTGTNEKKVLTSSGFKNLQDAADNGWSPVAAPVIPASDVPPVTAPISTSELSAPPALPQAQENQSLWTKIDTSYGEAMKATGGKAVANRQFISALAKYTGKPVNSSLVGTSLSDTAAFYGVGDRFSYLSAGSVPENNVPQAPVEIDVYMDSLKGELDKAQSPYLQEINENNKKALEIKEEMDKIKAKMDINKIYETGAAAELKKGFYEGKDKIEGEIIPMSAINARLSNLQTSINESLDKMNIESMLKDATNVYKYNQKAIEYNLYSGKMEAAQKMVQQTAQDFYNFQNLRLQYLEREDRISARDAEALRQEAAREFERMTGGYVQLKDPVQIREYKLKFGEDRVWTNPVDGKTYLLPDDAGVVKTIEVNGRVLGLDKSGNVVKDYGGTDALKWGVIGTDDTGNSQYGFIDTGSGKVIPYQQGVSTPNIGEKGGECGDYLHSAMIGTPKFGDTWQSKQAAMNMSPEELKTNPQVGDIVAFKTNLPYGHVAVITNISQDGQITLAESNRNLDQKIGTSILDLNNPNILGAYRGAILKGNSSTNQFSSAAKAYAKDILAGKIGIENVPGEKMKNETMLAKTELEKTEKPLADKLIAEGLQNKINDFDDVINNQVDGMEAAVGVYWFGRWTPFEIDKAERQNFIASVEQLIQQETIDKLIQSKAAGATYGALSDGEREMLSKAASKIGSWRIFDENKDENKKVLGYEIDEVSMKKELKTIRDLAQKAEDRILGDSVILPPGQISDESAYYEYLKTINQ